MGFGVWGLGFGVWGLGFGVWGLGFAGTFRRRRLQNPCWDLLYLATIHRCRVYKAAGSTGYRALRVPWDFRVVIRVSRASRGP